MRIDPDAPLRWWRRVMLLARVRLLGGPALKAFFFEDAIHSLHDGTVLFEGAEHRIAVTPAMVTWDATAPPGDALSAVLDHAFTYEHRRLRRVEVFRGSDCTITVPRDSVLRVPSHRVPWFTSA